MKKLFKGIIYTIAVLILLIIIFFAGYVIWLKSNSISVDKFINKKFLVYANIDNPVNTFERLNKSQILEILRSERKLNSIYKFYEKIRSILNTQSSILKTIASLDTHAVYYPDNSFTIIFDLGLRTLLARIGFTAFKTFLADENYFRFRTINYKNFTINKVIELESRTAFNFIHYKNLFVLSQSEERLKKVIDTYKKGNGLNTSEDFNNLKSNSRSDAIIKVYGNSGIFLKNSFNRNSKLGKIISLMRPGIMSFNFVDATRRNLELTSTQRVKIRNKIVKKFFSASARKSKADIILPESTSNYACFIFNKFQEVWDFFRVLFRNNPDVLKSLKTAEQKIKELTNQNLKQFLFSWIKNEIGVGTLMDQSDPFLVIQCSSPSQAIKSFERLNIGAVSVSPHKFQYKGFRVNQVALPPGMLTLARLFVPSLRLPYFMVIEDLLIITQSRRVINEIIDAYKKEKVLRYNENFKRLSRQVDYEGNFIVYWDLQKKNFGLLRKRNVISKIIRQYNRGILTLNFTDNYITQRIFVEGVEKSIFKNVSPFPKSVSSRLRYNPIFYDIDDDDIKEIIISEENGNIHVLSTTGSSKYLWRNKRTKSNLPGGVKVFKYRGKVYLAAVDYNGKIYVWDHKGEFLEEFSNKKVDGKVQAPVAVDDINNDGIPEIIIGTIQGGVYAIDMNGNFLDNFPLKLNKGIFTKPIVADFTNDGKKEIIISVRSFKGEIFIINNKGEKLENFTTKATFLVDVPLIADDINDDDLVEIIAFTRNGKLVVFNKNGVLNNFPLKIGSSIRNSGIVFKSSGRKYIASLLSNGKIAVISAKGKIVKTYKSKGKPSPYTELKLFKIRDIFVFSYGGNNKRLKFIPTKGQDDLPYKGLYGSVGVDIVDMDNDGYLEVLSAGYDRRIYLYKLFK